MASVSSMDMGIIGTIVPSAVKEQTLVRARCMNVVVLPGAMP